MSVMNYAFPAIDQPIVGYHLDEEGDWVAELACGHNQHVRHNPPWNNRPWTATEAGRQSMIGQQLGCRFADYADYQQRSHKLLPWLF